jgi:hypothetical protein
LRERPEDILHLANHFLEIFSVQYQKNVRRITPAAASALTRHTWPGNVRELQNRVMQAVILSEGSQLRPEDLGLTPASVVGSGVNESAEEDGLDPAPRFAPPITDDTRKASPRPPIPYPADAEHDATDEEPQNLETLLFELREKLADLVYSAEHGLSPTMLPLGRWLDEDLLVAADTLANGVARRAAAILGLPETTFRRRLCKAKDQLYAGLSPRVADWEDVRPTLTQLARCAADDDQDLIALAQRVLLEEIVARYPDNVRTGASLLAVSNPTYRKRLAELESSRSGAGDRSTPLKAPIRSTQDPLLDDSDVDIYVRG